MSINKKELEFHFRKVEEGDWYDTIDEGAEYQDMTEQVMLSAENPVIARYNTNLKAFLTAFILYEMHTNFNISEELGGLINRVDGVEAMAIVTPYRILIAFGHLFDVGEVQAEIRRRVNEYCDLNDDNDLSGPLLEGV